MIKKRIFSVILAVLLVVTCASEAMFIKFLQNDNTTLERKLETLQKQVDSQEERLQLVSNQVDNKADDAMIRFYLPDDIYVCETKGADIYNSSVVYGINLNSYAFHWEAPIGNSRNDRFEIPPMSKAGDYEVTLRIYDLTLNELAAKTARLHIVPDLLETANASAIKPLIYSTLSEETPEFLKEYLRKTEALEEDGEEETEAVFEPNVIIIFPSVYEVYADLDSTVSKAVELVKDIRTQYPETQILFVEPAYPGSNAEEEAQLDEEGNRIPKWAYAEKTMIFKLVSTLEKTFVEDDTVRVIPNALMTNSETDSEKVGNAIYSMLCRLISEERITVEGAETDEQ